MPLHRSATLLLAASLAAAAACSQRRALEEPANSECTGCHGGADNATGAPPRGLRGETATTDLAVGAHSAHVTGSVMAPAFGCPVCHPDPRTGSTVHGNGTVNVAFSLLAAKGVSAAPAWNPADATCSGTYCHGATLSGGSHTAPVWTKVGQGEAACGTCHGFPPPDPHPVAAASTTACHACHGLTIAADGAFVPPAMGGKHLDGTLDVAGVHDAAWMDPLSPSFHAYSADLGLAGCQGCHGQDLAGGRVGVACAACHVAGGPAPAFDCTGCHGGTDNTTGAPPRTTWGNGSDPIRIGAHSAHVQGSALAPPLDCGNCHVKPATMFSAGHVDQPTATVTFGGLAVTGGATPLAWDRSTPTCSSTYCHGATLGGGTNKAPLWTGGAGEAACGTCHGIPPPSPHPATSSDTTVCNLCHPGTVDAAGQVIPPASGGLHLDGTVESSAGHGADWMNTASTGFHAYSADQGLASCQVCHGPLLDGVGGITTVACAGCHTAAGPAPALTCTGCHGGTDNQTGAPPRTTWGQSADPIRTGAHTAHVTGGPLAPPFACTACHPAVADMFTQGHITSATTATVYFTGIASTGISPAPIWDRAAATCAVYCHGATLAGGTNTAPLWTGGSGQATCGTCHGLPPPAPHPGVGTDLTVCVGCHPATMDASGALIPPSSGGKHLNGQIDGGHLASWMDTASPDFHAYSADRGLAMCQICHGPLLDGVGGTTTVACAGCHYAGGTAPSFAGCTGCHGGTDNQTGAPPRATWGNAADLVRVGAHSSHVGTNPISAPIACAECHVTPADMFSAGHIDAARATVAFAGPIDAQAGGTWNYPATGTPTCSSTYCHGNFVAGNTTNAPSWTGTNQAACGTCHGAAGSGRPQGYLHRRHQDTYFYDAWYTGWVTCDQCHFGIAASVDRTTPPTLTTVGGSGPVLHVNGTKDVVFKNGGTWTPAPFEGTCTNMACHPGQTMTWPR